MRMDSDRRVHERMLLGELDPGVQIGRPVAIADGDHGRDSGFVRACDDFRAIGLELLAIEMCVRIDEHGKTDLGLWTSDLGLSTQALASKFHRLVAEVGGPRSEVLFEPSPHRHIFQETGQYWLAALERS